MQANYIGVLRIKSKHCLMVGVNPALYKKNRKGLAKKYN
jgi:hypothetical protein